MPHLDGNDVLIALGLTLVGTGVAMWSLPAAAVVVGLVLLGLGLAGAVRKAGT